MFSGCHTKVGHKRIFLFTNHDNPAAGNENSRSQSIQRAKDLAELGIGIELFSMNKPGQHFDATIFYQDIISVDEDDNTGTWNYDAASKFEELRSRLRRKEFKKRSLGRLAWTIAEGQEIGVRIYSLVQETKRSSFEPLDAKTNRSLKRVTKYVCEDTASLLMSYQIAFSYNYGEEQVILEKSDIEKIKFLCKPGIVLLGFKPRTTLKDYQNLKHSSFIYPDESYIRGSTLAFSALLDRMLALEKIAIVRITPRNNSSPRLAALLPQKETFEEDGLQADPPGFHVILLPFANDIRRLPDTDVHNPKASDMQISLAKKLVKTLRIKFASINFENPTLQKHYANLQALALDRETTEHVDDFVQPDEEGMLKFSGVIEEFKESVISGDYNPDPKKTPKGKNIFQDEGEEEEGGMVTPPTTTTKKTGKKRPWSGLEDGGEEPAAKRSKKTPGRDPKTIDWKELVNSGQLSKCNMQELKAYCSTEGIKKISKLSKAELVGVVESHIKKEKK